MRTCICILIAAAMSASCTSDNPEAAGTVNQGVAELRIDAGPLLAANITRVTVEAAGRSQDLVLNTANGSFDATLFLPSGTQSLVARAFSGDTLVGQSSPTAVAVVAGVVTRVLLHILDLTTAAPPIYGPIFDSLTFPTTADAGLQATFAISVAAPAGDPVTYNWTSGCPGSTFTTPHAATTGWSQAAPGTCTINVTASSNGFSVVQSFAVVVFPAGSGSGGLDVSSEFVTAPTVSIQFFDLGCFVTPAGNASCPGTTASPRTPLYFVSVISFGGSTPGAVELSDSCGGRFGTSSAQADFVSGNWLPPVDRGVCIITARAVNGAGLTGTTTAAILVDAGTPATARPPQISAVLTSCSMGASDTECGDFPAGATQSLSGQVFWDDGLPGTTTVTDDCGGPHKRSEDTTFFGAVWTTNNAPGTACTTTVRATNLLGASVEVVGHYRLQ